MKFDFKVVHRSDAHHQAANAMSCLPRAFLGEREESKADADDDVPAYCILGHVLNAGKIPQKKRSARWTSQPPLSYVTLNSKTHSVNMRLNFLESTSVSRLKIKDWFAEKHLACYK